MKELAINKHFTQSGCLTMEALEKYYSGDLPEKDKKMLSAHIEKCDLCSDALEGMELIPDMENANKTIAELNQSLNKKYLKEKGQSSNFSMKFFYYSAAASIIILIGVLSYLNFSAKKLSSDTTNFIVQENIMMPIPPPPSLEIHKNADNQPKKIKKIKNPKSVQAVVIEKLQHITVNFSEIEEEDFFDENIEISMDKNENTSTGKIKSKGSGSPEGFLMEMIVINNGTNASSGPSAPEHYLQLEEEVNIEKAYEKKTEEIIFTIVETMPQFPGGENGLRNYLQKKLRYPSQARNAGVEGKVYISFVVNSTGRITDTKIVKGIGEGCNEEALQVVSEMPFWKPATQQGRPVSVRFVIPVYFKLN